MKKHLLLFILNACFLNNGLIAQNIFQQSYGIAFVSSHSQQQAFTFNPIDRPAYDVLTPT